MTEDRADLDRRPLYKVGQRVRIVAPGHFYGEPATVLNIQALQTVGGILGTYFYRMRLDNLAEVAFMEQDITAVEGGTRDG